MKQDKVESFARRRFGAGSVVVPLAGDASDRRFYRLKAPHLASLVLMVHPDPFVLERLPFFLHGRFLHGIGAAVPQIIASYPDEGILVVQDLGDDTLVNHLRHADASRRRFLYLQAVQMIVFLQQEGTRCLTDDLPAATTALDRERLMYEMSFFLEHYVSGLLGSPLPVPERETLERWLGDLAAQVARYPRVLCHRDFHSRNLMVRGDRLYMVDFQDARLGPYTYDLVSLIRDSYTTLPDDLVAELIQYFRDASRAPESESIFGRALVRTSLQRNIKALGTFGYQEVERGSQAYRESIPRTLDSIRARLAETHDDPEAAVIRDLFAGPLAYPPGRC